MPYQSADITLAPGPVVGQGAAVAGSPPLLEKPRPRQELAVRRFTQYCRGSWGNILFHKVGTGKTLTSLLIALNSLTEEELANPAVKIYVVAPPAIFTNFTSDLTKYLPNWAGRVDKFVDYDYPTLISDLNKKKVSFDFTNSVVIFDEAHRLLGRDVFNSAEAGSSVQKHPILEDIFFISKINKAKKCIVMTGTPIQVDIADICRFLNFVTRSDKFNVETYAPATLRKTTEQFGFAILTNYTKSLTLQNTAGMATTAYSAFTLSQMSSFATATGTTVTSLVNLTNIILLLSAAIVARAGYREYKQWKADDEQEATETKKELQESRLAITKRKFKLEGGTRKRFKGGFFPGFSALAATAGYTFGPAGLSKPKEEIAFKFMTEWGLQFFQETSDELYLNNWQVERLAKDASPYISIYDPDIQIKLKGSAGEYNPEGEAFNAYLLGLRVTGGWTTNDMGIDNLYLQSLLDPTKALDMPKALTQILGIPYTEYQMSILREAFTGELRRSYREILYLDKYDSKTPDVKQKYKFFRAYARMIGNFSEDVERYYTVINESGTDYQVFERSTGNEITRLPDGIFACPKFEDCLAKLIATRHESNRMDVMDIPNEDSGDALEFNIEKYTTHIGKLQDMSSKNNTSRVPTKIPHPHLKAGKQFLPLVYSYTEDYGLSLFCMFLKSKGYNYILCHTNQESTELKRRIDAAKSKDVNGVANPGFDPLTEDNKAAVPLCALIHPSMTEGYDFVHNPAIFVLEPCNTFGDQEQVYGRVLRSYSKADMATFDNMKRKKLIVQYACSTGKDINSIRSILENLQSFFKTMATAAKLKIWQTKTSRLYVTPQNMMQILLRAKIESPDFFAIGRLQKEKIALKKFELSVGGGVQFADLMESLLCYSKLTDEGKVPEFCNPISGTPCKDPVDAEEEENVSNEAAEGLASDMALSANRVGRGGKNTTRKQRKH